MKLIRATIDNKLFEELEIQWKGQVAKYEENFEDYLSSYRTHSRDVIKGCHKNYFVYVLSDNGAHVAFLHVNYAAIKRLPGDTLRVLEIFLAPIYDYEDTTKDVMAKICAAIFTELLEISSSEGLEANNIKIHMGPLDKSYLSAFAEFYTLQNTASEVRLQGSWLVLLKK